MNGEKPSRELSINEILSLTFNLYFKKFFQFFLPFLISGIIIGIFTYAITSAFPMPEPPVIPESPSTTFVYEELMPWFFALLATMVAIVVLLGLLSWFVGTTVSGIVIKNASDQIEKGTSNLGASFSFAMSKLPSLLIAQFIVGILTVFGLLLLIVPGILVAIMFSLVIPAIIVEQRGSLESLGRSKELVRNRWGKAFLLALVLMIIVGIPMVAVNLLTLPLGDIHPILNPLTTNIISAFLSPIFSIGITYFYYAMVARQNPPPPTY